MRSLLLSHLGTSFSKVWVSISSESVASEAKLIIFLLFKGPSVVLGDCNFDNVLLVEVAKCYQSTHWGLKRCSWGLWLSSLERLKLGLLGWPVDFLFQMT